MTTVHDLAFVRSGDKGDVSNVVVLARDGDCYAALDRGLGAERISDYLAGLVSGSVRVHRLPRLQAFNVVLGEALGGGATRTLRFDETGKSMCAILSRMPVGDDAS